MLGELVHSWNKRGMVFIFGLSIEGMKLIRETIFIRWTMPLETSVYVVGLSFEGIPLIREVNFDKMVQTVRNLGICSIQVLGHFAIVSRDVNGSIIKLNWIYRI